MWTKVTDSMPPMETGDNANCSITVLVYDPAETYPDFHISKGWYDTILQAWVTQHNGSSTTVTNWMNLPEPPTE